jgi:hypothetical protein
MNRKKRVSPSSSGLRRLNPLKGAILARFYTFRLRLSFYGKQLTYFLSLKTVRASIAVFCFCGVSIWTDETQIQTGKDLASNLFSNAESIAIASTAVIFFLEIPDRKKRNHYEAWQVITAGLGHAGNGGRIQALQDLNKDKVDLEGVAAPDADLSGINLRLGD